MHHKRKRSKNGRAGCLMCKPHKMNGYKHKTKAHKGLGKVGFSKLKKLFLSVIDLNETNRRED